MRWVDVLWFAFQLLVVIPLVLYGVAWIVIPLLWWLERM